MISDEKILVKLSNLLDESEQEKIHFSLRKNKMSDNSILLQVAPSLYCSSPAQEILFAKISKINKKNPENGFVSFYSKYAAIFTNLGLKSISSKSQKGFISISLISFMSFLNENPANAAIAIKDIIFDLLSSDPFGCCSRYVECSDQKKCIHPDFIFAASCQYKRNLEQGRIFYGKNKNI